MWHPQVNSEMMAVSSYYYYLYQQVRIFVFINFSRDECLEQFHPWKSGRTSRKPPPQPIPRSVPDPGYADKGISPLA